MKTSEYSKILWLFCLITGFCGIINAQGFDKDAIKKSVLSKYEKDKAEEAKDIKRVETEIKAMIDRLNQQYRSKISNSPTLYVLQVSSNNFGTLEAVFPDLASCQKEMAAVKRNITSKKYKTVSVGSNQYVEYCPKEYINKICTSTTRKNTNYNPNNQSNININTNGNSYQENDVANNNTSQIQGSIFAVSGARERKPEQPDNTNNKAPEIDLSNLGAYIDKKPVEKEKTITDDDIKGIIESCVNSSNFCECVQSKFTQLTGKNLSGKNSQIRSNADIETNRMFNEYLGKIHNALDIRAENQKKELDEKFKAEWAEKYKSTEMVDMAKMANYVYGRDELPGGWKKTTDNNTVQNLLKSFNDQEFVNDGFFAEIYQKKGTNEYVLAFRGSESPLDNTQNIKDWITNASQGMGSDLFRTQYEKSTKLINDFKATCENCSISITGHSLGGGLASVAGLESGLPTYTFNAAGVHPNTIQNITLDKKLKEKYVIKAYYSNDDPLNQIQDKRYADFALNNPDIAIAGAGALLTPVGQVTSTVAQVGGIVSGTPEGHVVSEVASKAGNPVSAISTIASLPPALGTRNNIGDTGGHGIKELIYTIVAPLEKAKGEIDISKIQLKTTLSSCAASD